MSQPKAHFSFLPQWIRQLVTLAQERRLRRLISKRYRGSGDPEVQAVLSFVVSNPSLKLPLGTVIPAEWTKEYREGDIKVYRNASEPYPWIEHLGREVYFPADAADEAIKKAVVTGLREQDPRSPHAYLGGDFQLDNDTVAVFAGGSDGLFCLSCLPKLKRAYIFEPDARWHGPLKRTFSREGSRVQVFLAKLGAQTGFGVIQLDEFLDSERVPMSYLQADVEGDELAVLQGAQKTLAAARKAKVSICTYHHYEDTKALGEFLRAAGYETAFAPGYFVLGLLPPYLRRVVLRATKCAPSA